MKKLLPILLPLLGLAGGVMAGHFLKPAAEPAAEHGPATALEAGLEAGGHGEGGTDALARGDPLNPEPVADPEAEWEYTKLDKQFIVPVMGESRVEALIVLSVSIEAEPGLAGEIATREPKLRDTFLRVLFEHERAGGFSGVFTDPRTLSELRANLRKVARAILGSGVHDVLVTDILRQDV